MPTGGGDDDNSNFDINLGCVGTPLMYMAVEAVLYLMLAIAIEVGLV